MNEAYTTDEELFWIWIVKRRSLTEVSWHDLPQNALFENLAECDHLCRTHAAFYVHAFNCRMLAARAIYWAVAISVPKCLSLGVKLGTPVEAHHCLNFHDEIGNA